MKLGQKLYGKQGLCLSTFGTKTNHGLLLIFFTQICSIWNNFISYYKNGLLGHFPLSNFANAYEFLTSIEK